MGKFYHNFLITFLLLLLIVNIIIELNIYNNYGTFLTVKFVFFFIYGKYFSHDKVLFETKANIAQSILLPYRNDNNRSRGQWGKLHK